MQVPGIGTTRSTTPRQIFASLLGAMFLPGGRVIDGSESRDPLNTGDVDVLRPGIVMGKRSNNGLFAPSIIGTVTAAITAGAATVSVSVATGTELDRRIKAGGVFKIVGPTTDGGDDVRALTFSYSGTAKAGTITLATNAAVAEVQTSTLDALMTAGTFTLSYKGYTTADIAFDATTAQIQAALDALPSVNTGDITVQGAHEPDTELTCTWTFATTLGDVPMLSMDISAATGPTTCTFVETTPGELAGAATPGVTCVQTIDATNMAAGDKYVLKLTHPDTGVVYHTKELAGDTSTANIETELTTVVGANDIAVSGTVPTGIIFTFDDVSHNWANRPVPLIEIDITTPVPTATLRPTVTMTTAGVKGTFPIGSLIMPADGSENPLCLIGHPDTGIKVTDVDGLSVDVQFSKPVIGGIIASQQIINYPTESSLQKWLKATMNNAVGGRFVFNDDFQNLI